VGPRYGADRVDRRVRLVLGDPERRSRVLAWRGGEGQRCHPGPGDRAIRPGRPAASAIHAADGLDLERRRRLLLRMREPAGRVPRCAAGHPLAGHRRRADRHRHRCRPRHGLRPPPGPVAGPAHHHRRHGGLLGALARPGRTAVGLPDLPLERLPAGRVRSADRRPGPVGLAPRAPLDCGRCSLRRRLRAVCASVAAPVGGPGVGSGRRARRVSRRSACSGATCCGTG
jgi:hypothetical protein